MDNKLKQKFEMVKERLNEVSPSFCLAKWQQVTLHLQNGRTHSCHHPYPHAILPHEISISPAALHNTEFKKSQQQLMLDGKRPAECQYCWNIEDTEKYKNGEIYSDRITKSAEDWAMIDFDKIKSQAVSQIFYPRYVEVSFSSVCNLKCSYCSPAYSTKWQAEVEEHGGYPTSQNYNNLEYFYKTNEILKSQTDQNIFQNAFWAWWPDLAPHLKILRVTGGEPLLSPHTFRLFKELNDNPRPQLELAINTNASLPEEIIEKFVREAQNSIDKSNIKSIHLYCSLDGFGPSTEYSRFGLNFENWQKNVENLLTVIPSARLTIMCTTQIFSVQNFNDLIEYVLKLKKQFPAQRITIDTAILRYPHHLNLSILSDTLKTSFDTSLLFMKNKQIEYHETAYGVGFYDFEIHRLERLIQYIKKGPQKIEKINIETARSDFYIFVNEHDRRRGTHFLGTFPVLNEFYKICEKAHAHSK